jgi:hypothetical protein
MSNVKVVDVIIRKTAEKTKLTGDGNLSVSISSPSVIEIQGSAQDVVRYVRQGKDLLIYMKDGSVIRCNNYFVEDPETHHQSELVFNDHQELTHISFADAGEASGAAVTELTAQATPISSIEPFLEQESVLSDAPWGWIAGAAWAVAPSGRCWPTAVTAKRKRKSLITPKKWKVPRRPFAVGQGG